MQCLAHKNKLTPASFECFDRGPSCHAVECPGDLVGIDECIKAPPLELVILIREGEDGTSVRKDLDESANFELAHLSYLESLPQIQMNNHNLLFQ